MARKCEPPTKLHQMAKFTIYAAWMKYYGEMAKVTFRQSLLRIKGTNLSTEEFSRACKKKRDHTSTLRMSRSNSSGMKRSLNPTRLIARNSRTINANRTSRYTTRIQAKVALSTPAILVYNIKNKRISI